MIQVDRLIPEIPRKDRRLRLLIDTDFGNEVDDFFAVALAVVYPQRFRIEGIVAANFNNSLPGAGPGSIDESYRLLRSFLDTDARLREIALRKGSHPMQYMGFPSQSEGVDFIIDLARTGSMEDPLWVVGLGAGTDLASAILKAPDIMDKVRYVFHARSHATWPERSKQFNVLGDIHAARTLLIEPVPLIWFDTGTHLLCPNELTDKYVGQKCEMGRFIQTRRTMFPDFVKPEKGFFDMGDIAMLIDPECCRIETVKAPTMDPFMFFDHEHTNGPMLRVFDIDNQRTWNMLFDGMVKFASK